MRTAFAAPWGRTVRLVTVTACVIVGTIGTYHAWQGRPLGVVLFALLAASSLFRITGYEVTPTALVVRRPGWSTRCAWADLRSVAAEPGVMARSWRVAGNGGLFAFSGWFSNRQLGVYRAFVNDGDRAVVLRWPRRTIVVSPDEPAAFVGAVQQLTGSH